MTQPTSCVSSHSKTSGPVSASSYRCCSHRARSAISVMSKTVLPRAIAKPKCALNLDWREMVAQLFCHLVGVGINIYLKFRVKCLKELCFVTGIFLQSSVVDNNWPCPVSARDAPVTHSSRMSDGRTQLALHQPHRHSLVQPGGYLATFAKALRRRD